MLQARELEELAQIYVSRGLPYALARQVGALRLSHAGGCRLGRDWSKSVPMQPSVARMSQSSV